MRLFIYLLYILALTQTLLSSTRGDVKILEATENIQYLSQKIATDYFFLYKNPEDIILQKQLYKNINNLLFYIKEIKDISDITVYTRNLSEYFVYKVNILKKVPSTKINLSNIQFFLKYSEIILEGAKSIAKEHSYKFSKEEKMLMLSKEILYLLQRVNKYYMAIDIGLKGDINYIKMKKAILKLDNRLKAMNRYKYPIEFEDKLKKVNQLWERSRDFFYKVKEVSIPYILYNSSQYIEDLIKQIELYHKKNL